MENPSCGRIDQYHPAIGAGDRQALAVRAEGQPPRLGRKRDWFPPPFSGPPIPHLQAAFPALGVEHDAIADCGFVRVLPWWGTGGKRGAVLSTVTAKTRASLSSLAVAS